jgi:hypothetical protein
MNFNFNPLIQPKKITHELIKEIAQISPRRICFSSCHKDALKKEKGSYLGKFSLPFKETIKSIFEYETKLTLFPNFGRYWHSIKAGQEDDLNKIEKFIEKYKDVVFLRDSLDLSISLSENLSDKNEFTYIGDLENRAKYQKDEQATQEIAEICYNFIVNTPFYDSVDFICAVPPSDPEADNLPRNVIKQ